MVDAVAVNNLQIRSGNALVPTFAGNLDISGIRTEVLAYIDHIVSAFPTAPRDLKTTAATLMDVHQEVPRLGGNPTWITTTDQKEAWAKVVSNYSPIISKFIAGLQAQSKVELATAGYWSDFWKGVSAYTGVDAVEKVWDDLWNAINGLKLQREAAKTALDAAQAIIDASAGKAPANLVLAQQQALAEWNTLTNQARTTLAPLGATAQQQAGLGIAPLVIIGVSAVVVVGITASIWAIVSSFASVQKKAADNAQALMKWREEQDRQDYLAGKLTEDQYENRRAQNIRAGQTIVETQGAAAVGSAVGKAGAGLAMGVVAIGAVGLLGLFLFLKMRRS